MSTALPRPKCSQKLRCCRIWFVSARGVDQLCVIEGEIALIGLPEAMAI